MTSNNEQVFVSIIVPVYKSPLDYFKQCLTSLSEQTLNEAEFLIIFDGQNDNLYSIALQYQKKDSRFILSIQPHQGVSKTRNYGIQTARGTYITFVDSDDTLYSPKSLEDAYLYIHSINSDIFLFNWLSTNKTTYSIWPNKKRVLSKPELEYCLQQTIHPIKVDIPGAPWAKFFRRNFLKSNNISFKENCIIGQDRVFNYTAFSLAKKVSYSNDILYRYTLNQESATQRFRPNYLPIALTYIEELNTLSKSKYAPLIGRATLMILYSSWEKCYMNAQNNRSFFSRIHDVIKIIKSERFQFLIKTINTEGLTLIPKIEGFFLQHKIVFWIYLHGLKKLLFNKIHS